MAPATGATGASPALGTPVVLTAKALSMQPPAMTTIPGGPVLVASPDGDAVSLWALEGAQAAGAPVAVPALTGARAVSIATDGAGHVALVAEIGCKPPQTIAMAIGTPSGGFGPAVTVAPAGSAASVQPAVAWVPSQGDWLVSWISTEGGAHALARWFDPGGNAIGGVVDPSAAAVAATVTSDGNLFAYEPKTGGGSFVERALGCAP